MRGLCAFLRERFVVELARGQGIEAEVELIFPAEFEARLAQRVVAVLRAGMAFGGARESPFESLLRPRVVFNAAM